MQVTRLWQVKQPLQVNLPRRVIKKVGTPNNMSNPHQCVINHDSQLVRKDAIPPFNHKITNIGTQLLGKMALQLIINTDRFMGYLNA